MAHRHKTGGRQRGTPNKITTAFKDAVRCVYSAIGGNVAFADWARANPTEFYRIAARMILSEVAVKADSSVTIVLAHRGYDDIGDAREPETLPMRPGHVAH